MTFSSPCRPADDGALSVIAELASMLGSAKEEHFLSFEFTAPVHRGHSRARKSVLPPTEHTISGKAAAPRRV